MLPWMPPDNLQTYSLYAYGFLVSALAGFAWLLRSKDPITPRSVLSAMLNTGMIGLGLCFLWCNAYRDHPETLLGMCALSGICGVRLVSMVSSLVFVFAKNTTKRLLGVELTENGDHSSAPTVPHATQFPTPGYYPPGTQFSTPAPYAAGTHFPTPGVGADGGPGPPAHPQSPQPVE